MSYYYGPIKKRVLKENIHLPVPSFLEYPSYEDIPGCEDPGYRGKIKVEADRGDPSIGVFFYPVLKGDDGNIELAPRLVAIIVGKKSSVLARAKREAYYLANEYDALGVRMLAPIVVDLDQKRIRLGFQGPASASA